MMVMTKQKPDNSLLAFPKDLKVAHDEVVGRFNALKAELESSAYKSIYEKTKKLEYALDGLIILVPKSISEIFEEGKALNHCVGNYSQRVLDGTTMILFIRKTESVNTPYFTLEYKNNSIVQVRGNRNQLMTVEVERFTDQWLAWANKKNKGKVTQHERRANA